MQLLPAPYQGSTCVDTEDAGFKNPLKFFDKYNYPACRIECFKKIAIEKCDCAYLIPTNGN